MDKELYTQIQHIEASHWWYVARRKIVFDWVFKILEDYPAPHILDIGCGTGFNLEYLSQHGPHAGYGLDLSVDALTFCRQRNLTRLVTADGSCIPFKAESFDLILALDMLEHLDNDLHALQEFVRILKPGGTLFLFVPAFMFLWGLQDEVSHHRRRYTAADLQQRIGQTPLQITKLTYANTFLFPMILAGRWIQRFIRPKPDIVSENDLSPAWSNGLLTNIFASERVFLRRGNFPLGVSLLCVARKLPGATA